MENNGLSLLISSGFHGMNPNPKAVAYVTQELNATLKRLKFQKTTFSEKQVYDLINNEQDVHLG